MRFPPGKGLTRTQPAPRLCGGEPGLLWAEVMNRPEVYLGSLERQRSGFTWPAHTGGMPCPSAGSSWAPLRSGRGPVGVGLPIGLGSCSLAGRLCSVSGDRVKERGRGAHCLGHLAHLLSQNLSKGMQGTNSLALGLSQGGGW